MKILITGHMGFVGKYFMRKYSDHEIVGIDIKEGNDCRDFFKTNDSHFDMIIHLAAIVGGRKTIEGNPLAVATDLAIDSDMIQWALRTKPDRVVYFSSSAAYPIHLQNLTGNLAIYHLKEADINLEDVRMPDLTYGWAKLTGEYSLQFLESEKIKVNIFRPFSGYGTDQDLDYPFPSYIDRAKNFKNPFDIWGDGTQVRDFIHMQDIVDAVDEAIKQDVRGATNLGSGYATSFNDLQKMVCQIQNYNPDVNHILDAPKGVLYRVCNPNKMLSFYTPKIDLNEGITRALKGII
jgi:nucleoside-diphosphate-sugar epimerase